jgi:hypothetical protein
MRPLRDDTLRSTGTFIEGTLTSQGGEVLASVRLASENIEYGPLIEDIMQGRWIQTDGIDVPVPSRDTDLRLYEGSMPMTHEPIHEWRVPEIPGLTAESFILRDGDRIVVIPAGVPPITREWVAFLREQAISADASDTRGADAVEFREIAAALEHYLPPP